MTSSRNPTVIFPDLMSDAQGISPSLSSSDALETTGSFCMLFTHQDNGHLEHD